MMSFFANNLFFGVFKLFIFAGPLRFKGFLHFEPHPQNVTPSFLPPPIQMENLTLFLDFFFISPPGWWGDHCHILLNLFGVYSILFFGGWGNHKRRASNQAIRIALSVTSRITLLLFT